MGQLRRSAVFLTILLGGQALLPIPSHLAFSTEVALAGWILAALIVGTIAHELGHAVAVRLIGERVLSIEFGGKLARITLHLGTIQVSVGLGLGGAVTYRAAGVSATRQAVVVAAGPLASLLVAPLCLLLPLPTWEAAYLSLFVFADAVEDLLPGTTDFLRARAACACSDRCPDPRSALSGPGLRRRAKPRPEQRRARPPRNRGR